MAATLANLLDTLSDEASRPTERAEPADAQRALQLLGRVLQRLIADGLTAVGGSERERWVGEAAQACTTGATQSDIYFNIGPRRRFTQLAAAVSDTVSLMRDQLSCGNRWALAIAVLDPVGDLTVLAGEGDLPLDRRNALIVADAAATVVARSVALDPPSALDSIPLDFAVPRPDPDRSMEPAGAIVNAIAGLEHSTRRDAARLSVADYLAVCIALQTLCRRAGDLSVGHDPKLHDAADCAARSWAAARAVLHPFDDGSRRPHRTTPPAVSYALLLDKALHERDETTVGRPSTFNRPVVAATCDAVHRVPTIANHLDVALVEWAATGQVLAYARDLPPRETRVGEYLAGFTAAGLVRADAKDLASARSVLCGARLLSVELAAQLPVQHRPASTVSNLAAANRARRASVTDLKMHAAAREVSRALQTYSGAPRGGRGPHR